MGGQVSVKSKLNFGTIFSITLSSKIKIQNKKSLKKLKSKS
jgi:chemotaxis protein histidine kinase CheA